LKWDSAVLYLNHHWPDTSKLSNLLDDMVTVRGGNAIFDVNLQSFIDDRANQGYYEDASLTPEQV